MAELHPYEQQISTKAFLKAKHYPDAADRERVFPIRSGSSINAG
jgi:hypothetical protein